ncbi:S1 family peptidase [Yoonia algicola]|uniref:Serine protease n=1 Tax=Yoonia algicola TaxID=3137368 RepID=A0AAN0NFN3_9RHOB
MTKIASVSYESKCIAQLCAIAKNDRGEIVRKRWSSGFFWRRGDVPFLITNRHCVTGRDGSNEPLKDGFDPIALHVFFRVPHERVAHDAQTYSNRSIEFHLWRDDEPDWQEHPKGSCIDVVALRFSDFPDQIHCVNDKEQYDHWQPEAGTDCFIVGYPEALGGSEGTPIWKRGSIASEPELGLDGMPVFLCDSATRKGLSGAPVFAKMLGNFSSEGRPFSGTASPQFFAHWTKFLGVYAGREGDEKDGFQLGRVWKASILSDVLNNTNTPESPFIRK